MLSITIKQPWAELIARGDKIIENRSWPTNYRGSLAIHAGKQPDKMTAGERDFLESDRGIVFPKPAELVYGAVIAIAELVDCIEFDSLPEALADDKHAFGEWCWILANVHRIEPVKATGKLGLWQWDDSILKGRVA